MTETGGYAGDAAGLGGGYFKVRGVFDGFDLSLVSDVSWMIEWLMRGSVVYLLSREMLSL